jgi:hypothetical protein
MLAQAGLGILDLLSLVFAQLIGYPRGRADD